ncbi:MAG: WG repeat-containing protein [Clostridia bacterium]|nr:WG repeat-containing protein [Clostridia bacterium]
MGGEVDSGFQKKKKIILTAIIVSVVLLVLIVFLLIYFMIVDANRLKFAINETNYKVSISNLEGEDIQKASISVENKKYDLFCVKDGDYYFNINSLASLLDYEYKKGEYDPVSEDSDKCYIINEGEYSSFSLDSNVIKKQFYNYAKDNNSSGDSSDIKSENVEIYTSDKEVIKIEDSLYASAESIKIGFNVQIVTNGNQITLYSLPYLAEKYKTYANERGYDDISSDFKNKRALVNDLLVVQDKGKYGVYSAKDEKELISTKYDSLEYVENINQFICTYSGKVGMISIDSDLPTIDIKYDSIELLDIENMLYMVSKGEKFGVVSGNGKIIVPIEYESIGLKDVSQFSNQNIESKYFIGNDLIIVSNNGKYGFYKKDGTAVKECVYEKLGCTTANKVMTPSDEYDYLNVLLVEIPSYNKNDNDEKNVSYGIVCGINDKYGILDENGEIIIPLDWDAVFLAKSNRESDYYVANLTTNEVKTVNQCLGFE